MTAFIEILEGMGSFLVGTFGRFGAFFLAGLVLLVPALVLGYGLHLVRTRRATAHVRRSGARAGAWHAPNHTWLAPVGPGELRVGIDDLARRILPSVTWVELPAPGMQVHRGDPIAVLRAGHRTIQLAAPVDGVVRRVNRRARRDPGAVVREPYGGGWLFTIAPANGAWRDLPHGREADRWMRSEDARLGRFLEHELGYAAADGGALSAPLPALLGEDGWRKVVFSFLHAA